MNIKTTDDIAVFRRESKTELVSKIKVFDKCEFRQSRDAVISNPSFVVPVDLNEQNNCELFVLVTSNTDERDHGGKIPKKNPNLGYWS